MGYEEHQQPNSSGALVAVIGVGLVLAILGIVVVAAAGLFWVRASTAESRAVAMEQQVVAEIQRSEAVRRLKRPQAGISADPDPRLNFELIVDRKGNMRVASEMIGLDDLSRRLAELKDESSNAFSLHIYTDPECPVKHIIPLLDACDEVGDIDFRVVSLIAPDGPPSESDAES